MTRENLSYRMAQQALMVATLKDDELLPLMATVNMEMAMRGLIDPKDAQAILGLLSVLIDDVMNNLARRMREEHQ